MNAVEIEDAVTALAERPFDGAEFPYLFLQAFGNKDTTIKRLRAGASNKSDIGGVLQTNNIHIAVARLGEVTKSLAALKASPATTKAKATFVLATDGDTFEAEDLESGETVACDFADFPNHFGFFLSLAGITTIKQVRDSSFDIRATSRLNRLYVQLLKDNPDWGTAVRRHDMNHFMARLIFCFFAEDTDIFNGSGLFTATVDQMSAKDSSNTHAVISELFRAMNTKPTDRAGAGLPRWTDAFPYVNGGLFSGSSAVPRFSKIARSYFLHIGILDWTKINPDIFGSMIQAVADDEERGALGMHYTSVPNILKVLNPLFLDDLHARLEEAGDNTRVLLNLRNRIARIRVFDPACGSGNFLVTAYKEMRAIEAAINRRRDETSRPSDIPLTNLRGIELRDFSAEVARLALVIAEFQCDVLYRGKQLALAEFLPLNAENWITCGDALRLDWLSICPPTGTGVKFHADDLFHTPLDQAQIDFENEGGETYICGNPPYLGSKWQGDEHKADLRAIFADRTTNWKSLDYVASWFMKAADYGMRTNAVAAFVATNSICQGQQVPFLWPLIFQTGHEIAFAHTSFKWANLASHNAGVTVVIVGISNHAGTRRHLASLADDGTVIVKEAENINPYLIPGPNTIIHPASKSIAGLPEMTRGNSPTDGGYLILDSGEAARLDLGAEDSAEFIKPFVGSKELISGTRRSCIWIEDDAVERACQIPQIRERVKQVRKFRLTSKKAATVRAANWPYRFDERKPIPADPVICVPVISSENRSYLPADVLPAGTVVSNKAFTLPGNELWTLGIICSRMNLAWVATVCARMRTDFSYTNTLGWNTLPVPALTEKNKADLAHCAQNILLVRETHFPATIADLYGPDAMPADLREAHERNDEVLERIYIGRRFRNDTERLEKLFDLYTKTVAVPGATKRRLMGVGA
jgi:hypothetical protein